MLNAEPLQHLDVEKRTSSPHRAGNKLGRLLWGFCWRIFYRPTPRPAHRFRVALLRLFGGDIHATAHPYPHCKIWAPWNLEMGPHSCLADDVDCYNVARISLGAFATVSQYSYLCSASHDHNDPAMPLFSEPIRLGAHSWVAARSYIGPGVEIGEGAVVGANACVYKNVAPWMVVGGNPARTISRRTPFIWQALLRARD